MQKLPCHDSQSKEYTLKARIPKSRLVLPKMERNESFDESRNKVRKYQSQILLEETKTLERVETTKQTATAETFISVPSVNCQFELP